LYADFFFNSEWVDHDSVRRTVCVRVGVVNPYDEEEDDENCESRFHERESFHREVIQSQETSADQDERQDCENARPEGD
jgi:hypothetical protein